MPFIEFSPPLSEPAIVEEIARLTDLDKGDIKRRVRAEIAVSGWNVCRDAELFGVSPHRYDANMERLYQEGYGFIFETLVFWSKASRLQWTADAVDRIHLHARKLGLRSDELHILMLGDGTGSDSLRLISEGFHVDYFDFPDSKTYAFTKRRFQEQGVLDTDAAMISDVAHLRSNYYDVVLCFEVLEHLPEPRSLIHDIAKYLRVGGIALVTESFRNVEPLLPTHLASNRRFDGKTVFMFARCRLVMTWYSTNTLFKPTEYSKKETVSVGSRLRLIVDPAVMKMFIGGRVPRLRALAKRLLR